MPQDEIIDLLVVTHIDSDHIAGIIALVKHMKENGETHRLKQVWFNFPKNEETDEYSVGEGNELTSFLLEIDGLCWNNNTSELLGSTIEVGEIRLHVLAPDHDVANEYKPKEPDELGVRLDDWHNDLRTLIDNVDDDDIDEGGPNSQSIIILAECEGKKLLLPGDSTPEELCDALQYYNKINGAPLELDFMKLPHHGSTRNVTKNIFDEVTCSNFIISTKKNEKYYFPNKETIAKLIRYRERADKAINVYFNYQESLDVLGITAEELTENNINLNVCNEFNF
jgi:putative beta-lactamase protein